MSGFFELPTSKNGNDRFGRGLPLSLFYICSRLFEMAIRNPKNRNLWLAVTVIVVAAGLLLFVAFRSRPANTPPSTGSHGSAPPPVLDTSCSSPVKSFCVTQNRFAGYVRVSDFSDILGSQVVDHVTCGTASAISQVCSGVSGKLAIDAFKVQQSGTTTYMTRNTYITYFLAFSQQYAPFSLTDSVGTNTNMTLNFLGAAGTEQLSFVFHLADGTWEFLYPSVSAK